MEPVLAQTLHAADAESELGLRVAEGEVDVDPTWKQEFNFMRGEICHALKHRSTELFSLVKTPHHKNLDGIIYYNLSKLDSPEDCIKKVVNAVVASRKHPAAEVHLGIMANYLVKGIQEYALCETNLRGTITLLSDIPDHVTAYRNAWEDVVHA